MSGETSPDIRGSSYLSSALVNYVIEIFLMEERRDERERERKKTFLYALLFLLFLLFFLDKRIKRENKRKVLTIGALAGFVLVHGCYFIC